MHMFYANVLKIKHENCLTFILYDYMSRNFSSHRVTVTLLAVTLCYPYILEPFTRRFLNVISIIVVIKLCEFNGIHFRIWAQFIAVFCRKSRLWQITNLCIMHWRKYTMPIEWIYPLHTPSDNYSPFFLI